MDQILKNLADPSWWFTGIFFLLAGVILTKILSNWLPNLLGALSKFLPIAGNRLSRWKKKKIMLQVKKFRQHEVKINWLIARYWSIATVMIMYMGFALVSFLLYPAFHGSAKNKILTFALFAPAYGLQFLVIWEKQALKAAMTAYIDWVKNTRGSVRHV
jgi:hypothetical protein